MLSCWSYGSKEQGIRSDYYTDIPKLNVGSILRSGFDQFKNLHDIETENASAWEEFLLGC